MKTILTLAAILTGAAVLLSSNALAFREPDRVRLPDIDKRLEAQPARAALRPERAPAVENLRARLPQARVDFDFVTGAPMCSPKRVAAPGGFLSGSGGNGQGVSDVVAAEFRADEFIIARGGM